MDNCINLTEEQSENLGDELERLVIEYISDKYVDSIYFTPLKGYFYTSDEGKIKASILKVTIVCKNKTSKYYKHIEKYNISKGENQEISKYGLRIYIVKDDKSQYTLGNRDNNLLNATILYDRTGYYRNLKKQISSKDDISYYNNLASINPEVDDNISVKIKEKYGKITKGHC